MLLKEPFFSWSAPILDKSIEAKNDLYIFRDTDFHCCIYDAADFAGSTAKSRIMTAPQATAEVFRTALRALNKKERSVVLRRLFQDLVGDKEFMEDLIDLLTIEQRRRQPSRSLDEYLAEKQKNK